MNKELEALSRIEDCFYEDPYADRNDISYENDIATVKQALLEPNRFSNKLLMAKKNGFFDGYGMWRNEDFVIDYDTVREEFYLRSITVGYSLGKTRFYESDYKKTWWLNKNKEE